MGERGELQNRLGQAEEIARLAEQETEREHAPGDNGGTAGEEPERGHGEPAEDERAWRLAEGRAGEAGKLAGGVA